MSASLSFTAAFGQAIAGEQFSVVGLADQPVPLPTDRWVGPPDAADLSIVERCEGPTLDIGCGPGRLTAALADRGHVVLGIDVVPEAVRQTTVRGAAALHRSVFSRLPGEGRWRTALLADGNVGIGGDPVALLERTRDLIASHGRIVVEVAEPGVTSRTVWAQLEGRSGTSRPFRWAVVSADDIDDVADRARLQVSSLEALESRWCAVLKVA